MTPLRVASFNIRNGRAWDGSSSWPFRRRATAAAIAGLGADVVGLQEVYGFQLRYLLHHFPNVTAVGEGRGRGGRGEHVPLLIAGDRVRVLDHVTRWFGDAPDRPGTVIDGARFPRIATIALLEVVATGRVFQVANTHLDSDSSAFRSRSSAQLASWMDPTRPRIVLGDLNAEMGQLSIEPLLRSGYRPALPPMAGGTNHDFTGRRDGSRIDHVLVSADVAIVDGRVEHPKPGGRLPSDHWPVVADLQLP